MREVLQRLLPLMLVFLCVLSSFSRAHLSYKHGFQQTAHGVGILNEAHGREPEGQPQNTDHNSLQAEIDGDQLVAEALSILRTIETSGTRYGRFAKSAGVVSTSASYAKKLFMLLFMNGPSIDNVAAERPEHETLADPLRKAVNLLKVAIKAKSADALYLLADMNFYGNFSHPRNYSEAFQRYHELADLTGNTTAQYMIGFMYATGVGGSVNQDQAKALLYHTFAALGGNTRSEMTVAYRHYSSIGTPRDCETAAFYYKKVAAKAMQYWRSGPPGGRVMLRDAYRMADEEGGVYGQGASASSAGQNAPHGGPHSDTHAALDDVLEYLDLLAGKGDFKATFSLGKLFYEGRRSMTRDPRKAKGYFMRVAKNLWARDGKIIPGAGQDLEEFASKAAAYLGRLYLDGEGVEQNFDKARMWFRRGVSNGDRIAQWGMGLLYLKGLGVPKDAMKASEYFKESADQEFGAAQVNMGALLLDQGDVEMAYRYFELAKRTGNLEAYYYLAEMLDQGVGPERSCRMATAYYKVVAERAESLHSAFGLANDAYHEGDRETALIFYMMAAEQGYEAGQANVAYMLDEQRSKLPLDLLLPRTRRSRPSLIRNPALALIYWTRSGKQANVDSMVKVGDYHLSGIGTGVDESKAASSYHTAADSHLSAQAQWNLGWMHENGIGVEQDFHLAKRFYDLALETNQEAYLPVSMSLLKLRLRSYWNTITNGEINSIRSDPEPPMIWTFREWIQRFVQEEIYKEEDEEDDPTNASRERLPVEEDLYDDVAMNDGLLESFIIIGLAAALGLLVYYRQNRQLRHQREVERNQAAALANARAQNGVAAGSGDSRAAEANDHVERGDAPQQQPPPREDRGFFPQPGDPEHGAWVVGGVMH